MMNPFRRGVMPLGNSFKTTMNMGWLTQLPVLMSSPATKSNTKSLLLSALSNFSLRSCIWLMLTAMFTTLPIVSSTMNGKTLSLVATMALPLLSLPSWFLLPSLAMLPVLSPTFLEYLQVYLISHSALPVRMYNLVYNTAYRDSQLQTEIPVSLNSGLDTTTPRNLLAPCWKRDYFTKCRPAPQLGADVILPLTGDAPVVGLAVNNTVTYSGTAGASSKESDGTSPSGTNWSTGVIDSTGSQVWIQGDNATKVPDIRADLTGVTGVTPRELRESNAAQRFLEFNNIYGGRYIEQMMARFGSRIPDDRIQLPEYIGSGSTKIQFSEVLATAESTDVDVGQMKGHGISLMASNRYSRAIPEFGWIQVYLIVRPKTQYAQGLHRSWSRQTKYDYLLPEFQDIGDQAVLNKEIYAASPSPNAVFGYTPQYEEYRTIPSRLAGEFLTSQDYWTLYRAFSSAPALNSTFVTCNPSDRIFPVSVQNADSLIVSVNHDIVARRPLRVRPDYKLM